MEQFKAKVHSDDSGLTLADLRKLDSVHKKEYIKAIIEDSTVTQLVLDNMNNKVEENLDEAAELEMNVQDT